MKKEEIYVVIDNEPKRLRVIEILTNAREKIFPGSEMLYENPFNSLVEFFDEFWLLSNDANLSKIEITIEQLEILLNPNFVVKEVVLSIDELQKQAESLGFELIKKERQIKVGDFGKFFDDENNENNCVGYGFITSMQNDYYQFKRDGICPYRFFRHLTDEEKKQIQENW